MRAGAAGAGARASGVEWSHGHGAVKHGPSMGAASAIGQGSGASGTDAACRRGVAVRITTSTMAALRM